MKKNLYLTLGCLSFSLGLLAAPLSPEQSLERLDPKGPSKVVAKNKASLKLVYTQNTENNSPALYLFKNGNSIYFLSADDVAAPLLGYADDVTFDPNNIPPQLKDWMEGYAAEIEAANQRNIGIYKAPSSASPQRETILPLVKAKWDQTAPYNQECPVINDHLSVTGCVATSVAMAMHYFKYPEIGQGNMKYTTETYKKSLMINFAKQPFDWANMLDEYKKGKYNEDQAAAVAYLMKCCGYAVEMDYTPDMSGAVSSKIPEALKNYFGYDKGTYYTTRNFYSPTVWEQMIYDNLKNVGPVVYSGASAEAGGHSFICDGYDGSGYFHFNWGWGGMSDGYFLLSSLSPSSLGVGGGLGGFNFRQAAVLGMQPPKEGTVAQPNFMQQRGSLTAEMSGSTIKFSTTTADVHWVNSMCPTFTFNFGIIAENVNNPSEVKYIKSGTMLTVNPNTYFPTYLPTFPLSLGDGKYKLTLATVDAETNEYTPVKCDYRYNNYIYLTKNGSKYEIELPKDKIATVTTVKLDSELYPGVTAKINVTLRNDLDVAISATVAPVLSYEGKTAFSAPGVAVDLEPNQTLEVPIYAQFSATADAPYMNQAREMTLMVADYSEGQEFIYPGASETVTLQATPGRLSLRQKGFTVYAEKDESDVYIKLADQPLKFTDKVNVNSGVFAYPLYVLVFDEEGTVMQVAENYGGPMTILEAGETYDFDCELEFPQGIIGETYTCFMGYQNSGVYSRIGSGFKFKVTDGAGVSDILADGEDQPVEIYNLQGLRIESPVKGQTVIVRKGKKVTKVIW
ncbi:MAG: C10 family peptidase [Muribaculaceae bacterium]|nr:C10 family peptidase [Muribaculaceae bacterium]